MESWNNQQDNPDAAVRPEDVLEPDELKRYYDLMSRYGEAALEAKQAAARMEELKGRIGAIVMDTGHRSFTSDLGASYIKAESLRMTFDKALAVKVLAKYNVPVTALEECYKASKVKASVVIRMGKDDSD